METENLSFISKVKKPICPLCHEESEFIFKNRHWNIQGSEQSFRYANCKHCNILFCNPMPTIEELKWVYNSFFDFNWYKRNRFFKKKQALHRYKKITHIFSSLGVYLNKGNLLDIGCGHGWFLHVAKRDNWHVAGIDYLDDKLQKQILNQGMDFYNGDIFHAPIKSESYDIITMWHFFEHVVDPEMAIKKMMSWLKPNGFCLIAVPNRDSLSLAREGLRWGWLQAPFVHLFCYSLDGIKKLIPKELKIMYASSRDTWDRQYIESTLLWKILHLPIRLIFGGSRKIFETIGLKRCIKCAVWFDWFFSQIIRCSFYSVYLVLRRWLGKYESSLKGNELLLVLQKR